MKVVNRIADVSDRVEDPQPAPPAPAGYCPKLWASSWATAVGVALLMLKQGAACCMEDVYDEALRNYHEDAAAIAVGEAAERGGCR